MVKVVKSKIDAGKLRDQLYDESSGGFCVFEGRMRRHNEGKAVKKLEYECYGPMALKQMEALIRQAKKRWKIRQAVAVHRTGQVALGELAVWVGVASVHRAEAFEACRFLIDGIKHQVPIWKRETYQDGTQAWVGCGLPPRHP